MTSPYLRQPLNHTPEEVIAHRRSRVHTPALVQDAASQFAQHDAQLRGTDWFETYDRLVAQWSAQTTKKEYAELASCLLVCALAWVSAGFVLVDVCC
jgi:hypothetical protein